MALKNLLAELSVTSTVKARAGKSASVQAAVGVKKIPKKKYIVTGTLTNR